MVCIANTCLHGGRRSSSFFGSKAGTFTSFFSRSGHTPSAALSPMGEASIHGGGAGGFRQARTPCSWFQGPCNVKSVQACYLQGMLRGHCPAEGMHVQHVWERKEHWTRSQKCAFTQ